MNKILLLSMVLLISCGRKQDDPQVAKDKENLAQISGTVNYNKNGYRNIYLNQKIQDVSVVVEEDAYEKNIVVEIKPTCSEEIMRFIGLIPNGPFSTKLELVKGTADINVALKCINEECSRFVVNVVEDKEGEQGQYPILVEKKEELYLQSWTPKGQGVSTRQEFDNVDLCKVTEAKNKKTIGLFIDFDDIDDQLGFFDSFFKDSQSKKASEVLVSKCENELKGTFVKESMGTVYFNMMSSRRMNLNTFQFEYDNFSYGQCVVESNFTYNELSVYAEGQTRESALKNAQLQCVNVLRGYVDDHYEREVHKVAKSNKWLAKLKCHELKGEEHFSL